MGYNLTDGRRRILLLIISMEGLVKTTKTVKTIETQRLPLQSAKNSSGLVHLLSIFTTVSFCVGVTAALSGCASFHQKKDGTVASAEGPVAQIIRVYKDPSTESSDTSSGAQASVTNSTEKPRQILAVVEAEVRGRKLKNNKFDYPIVINSAVEQWIDYFTGKGRPHFEKYLARSRYFIPTISKLLRANGMPQDLVYLAMIESGFNNVARSHASAVGPWQFIKATGRRYGLAVNYWLDERRDTRKSTMAAIGYLKELYQEFGSWEIAAASYNAGENKLRHAIARFHTKDFWEISRHKFLKSETRHYVPKIMAAAILSKNPELFGFEDPFSGMSNPMISDSGEMTPKELGEEVMAKADAAAGVKSDDKADIEIDTDQEDSTASDDSSDDDDDAAAYAAVVTDQRNIAVASSTYMVANPNEQIVEFEVKGPADLFAVSKAAAIPFSTVKALNPELMRWCTPPSMKTYRIKLPLSSKEPFLASYNTDSFERKVTFAQYKVRAGDTVSYVARRFTTQPDPIRELNRMGVRENSLRTGREIVLPIPVGYKRVIASLYDEKPMPSRGRRHRKRRTRRKHHAEVQIQKRTSHRLPTAVARD